ncbi:E3 ubiquitin-protein ligase SINA-like 11 [Triticum dicoccoides]|uniref:E3 ubiquitin-protein ligase SINA-like 11 n=1 Tax=Triticum dicoccoides TaxID=85692 RepID=UPI00188EEC5E|nr:E3 ubiquitin-protein ligase SINA-like 11 [Triticum dicoccoides]
MEAEGEIGVSGRKRTRGEGSGGGGGEQMVSVGSNCGVIELDALDCSVCYDHLRPPVFQCVMGHIICSSCYGNLLNKDKCHVCSITGGYNRCIAVEQILESVRAPCSNNKYGCTVKMHYHELKDHEKSCPRAPCFCPEAGCGFAGSTGVLLRHFTDDHGWPSTEFKFGRDSVLQIQEGMHVLHSREGGRLFLVKFTPVPPFGNAASILRVHPHALVGERKFRCQVGYNCDTIGWHQYSNLHPRSTNLSNGLPVDDGSYSLVVPAVPAYLPAANSIKITISRVS